ncbi:replication protein A 14 kDa subunit B-like [Selaginella moellendorffii]|uniref:replication protein A 14 kDa subunit B-like n=1 Tax=Selaginella moellendorffii TaxID=88036 RepID=UPI000D1D0458|nr:replication protein A 14 kDa subunit B-like [Selaginella moellendorffii]|eukprot:XP_024536662.1 replication protein A 14 kDa subunit B-like [Selaginella moellendorffii]
MDTSSPCPMVNGELLRRYPGRRVRCVIRVSRMEAGGSVIVGQTADNVQVTVKQMGAPPVGALTEFVEVIGVAEGDRSIRAETCTSFGGGFDMSIYNQLCQMANGEFQELFV